MNVTPLGIAVAIVSLLAMVAGCKTAPSLPVNIGGSAGAMVEAAEKTLDAADADQSIWKAASKLARGLLLSARQRIVQDASDYAALDARYDETRMQLSAANSQLSGWKTTWDDAVIGGWPRRWAKRIIAVVAGWFVVVIALKAATTAGAGGWLGGLFSALYHLAWPPKLVSTIGSWLMALLGRQSQ